MTIRFHTLAGRRVRSKFLDAIRERLEAQYAVWEIMGPQDAVEMDVIVDTRNASVYECHVSILHRGQVFHNDYVFWKRHTDNGVYTAMGTIVEGVSYV